MIISNDFRLHFYEELRKDVRFSFFISTFFLTFKHILIIVNADVDALCATAILTVRRFLKKFWVWFTPESPQGLSAN